METFRHPEGLVGSWKLVSARVKFSDTGETIDVHGPNPKGFAMISPNSRVMFLFMEAERKLPQTDADHAALLKGMSAYTGRFQIEGNRLTTDVDVAWFPSWEGSRQLRFIELEGDTLSFSTEEQDHPSYPGKKMRGFVVWQREV